ncbi:ABC transporter ATP-binding protein [Paenibacillus sp. L3-i20]|uniref:ABC transporter ATP-binding protein n=1 Tax=Paenibacillus sp. L3-i20 TaxID=2905833 RepID=UPI001EDE3609|nr:ABC transporter ATP-binding protein [Paenibacillus sp. L3-i20]GKU78281.1 hypothetical protein L3i20_v226780 [Paenibacillus sp. L3-i20]
MSENRGDIPVLQVEGLSVYHDQKHDQEPIIENIHFKIMEGQTVAIVGESGSGKSVTASAIAGLLSHPLRIQHGEIRWHGDDIVRWSAKEKQKLRGTGIGWMFQDYEGSLTPFIRIGRQLEETIVVRQGKSRTQARELTIHWLELMKLPAERIYQCYPFQLSGGQCQRVALASALMLEPSLLIADEPTTALDVLTGEAILDLIGTMQKKTGCAVMLISHDLRQVMKHSDEMIVMKSGKIVEAGLTDVLMNHAQHDYTKALINACPRLLQSHERNQNDSVERRVERLYKKESITF